MGDPLLKQLGIAEEDLARGDRELAELISEFGLTENEMTSVILDPVPPHELPNQLRVCYRGTLTREEAQAKIGDAYHVLELRPAQCLSEDQNSNDLVAATEVIFAEGHR